MKKFLKYAFPSIATVIAVLLLRAFMPTQASAADSGACYAINDADARQMCLARARHDSSQCYAIQRSDLRAECLAEVRK